MLFRSRPCAVTVRIREDVHMHASVHVLQQRILDLATYDEWLGQQFRAMSADDDDFAGEAADLLYHLIVLLRVRKLGLADAVAVLERRHQPPKSRARK